MEVDADEGLLLPMQLFVSVSGIDYQCPGEDSLFPVVDYLSSEVYPSCIRRRILLSGSGLLITLVLPLSPSPYTRLLSHIVATMLIPCLNRNWGHRGD